MNKILTDEQLENKIGTMKFPKVTKEWMEGRVTSVEYHRIPKATVIICHVTLDNGYSVRGESACVDPNNFDEEIGRTIAYKKAFEKLWPLFGFLLAESLFNARSPEGSEARVMHIAMVCHEVNRAYCAGIGDNSQVSWDDAEQWQKDSAVNGVNMHLSNPDAGPDASHESWMAEKVADGWVYGEVKDPEAKTHHCIVPFDTLDTAQQAKDYIFRSIVHSLK